MCGIYWRKIRRETYIYLIISKYSKTLRTKDEPKKKKNDRSDHLKTIKLEWTLQIRLEPTSFTSD